MGKFILVEGTDPEKYYDLTTVNDNIFPFEVRGYKYLHLRTSMDMSGSQAIIKLKEDDPYEMVCRPFEQQDVVYTEFNEGQDVTDQSAGILEHCISSLTRFWRRNLLLMTQSNYRTM